MINLEMPKKFGPLVSQAHQVVTEVFRPISRKYDLAEHEYPKELDMLAALIDGMNAGQGQRRRGRRGVRREQRRATTGQPQRHEHVDRAVDHGAVLGRRRRWCCRCPARASAMRDRVGRQRRAARALRRRWAAMAITEPEAGSDSAAIRTTAVLDGRRLRAQRREDLRDRRRARRRWSWCGHRSTDRKGRAAIKSFVVERDNPGLKLERLEHKLGIRASDTATFAWRTAACPRRTCWAPPEVDAKRGFAGVMQTFDNTRRSSRRWPSG